MTRPAESACDIGRPACRFGTPPVLAQWAHPRVCSFPMVMANKAALVLGASGSVGKALLAELRRSGSFAPIVVLSRGPTGEGGIVEKLIPTMTPAELTKAVLAVVQDLQGEVVGFSTLGIGAGTAKLTIDQHRAVDVALNEAFARGLKESGKVQHLAFLSAVGANKDANASGSGAAGGSRYNRVKGEAEAAVKEAGPPLVSIFRPAMILGSRHTPGILAKVIPLFAALTPAKYLSIRTDQIAQAMVAAAIKPPAQSSVLHYPEMMSLLKETVQ